MSQGSGQTDIIRLPSMTRDEVDRLLGSQRICRMALNDSPQPYIILLDYVYVNGNMYFHFADYGRKMDLIRKSPNVSVEVDRFDEDLTDYESVTLMGKLVAVRDSGEKEQAAEALLKRIRARGDNDTVAARHGFTTIGKDLLSSAGSALYRLDVREYVGLKAPGM